MDTLDKKMKWKNVPVKYGENRWAYRNERSIHFLEKKEGKVICMIIPLRYIKKVIEATP